MSNQGQGLLSHFYIGFVCFLLISGERLQDYWCSGCSFLIQYCFIYHLAAGLSNDDCLFSPIDFSKDINSHYKFTKFFTEALQYLLYLFLTACGLWWPFQGGYKGIDIFPEELLDGATHH